MTQENEHLKVVAVRNKQLFLLDKLKFEKRMISYGWTQNEVAQMEKHITRTVSRENAEGVKENEN